MGIRRCDLLLAATQAPIPGVRREDMNVEVVDGKKLEVTVKQGKEKKTDDETIQIVRRGFWSVTLPRDAHTHEGRVEYKDGMLRVFFPRDTAGQVCTIQLLSIQVFASNSFCLLVVVAPKKHGSPADPKFFIHFNVAALQLCPQSCVCRTMAC